MPGYSGTPPPKKLGIKPGFRIRTRGAPSNYAEMLGPVAAEVTISSSIRSRIDLWHLFTSSRADLDKSLQQARNQINVDGMIWASWPKKSSGVPSEITEDSIRESAFPLGLVDVKVCAVDEIWSGLKLVIRKELR